MVLSCGCLCRIPASQMLSRKWRCSWSSADRRCSNYIWVIDNFIAYSDASYSRDGSWHSCGSYPIILSDSQTVLFHVRSLFPDQPRWTMHGFTDSAPQIFALWKIKHTNMAMISAWIYFSHWKLVTGNINLRVAFKERKSCCYNPVVLTCFKTATFFNQWCIDFLWNTTYMLQIVECVT